MRELVIGKQGFAVAHLNVLPNDVVWQVDSVVHVAQPDHVRVVIQLGAHLGKLQPISDREKILVPLFDGALKFEIYINKLKKYISMKFIYKNL